MKRIKSHTRKVNGKTVRVKAHDRRTKPAAIMLAGLATSSASAFISLTVDYTKKLFLLTRLTLKGSKMIVSYWIKGAQEEASPADTSLDEMAAKAQAMLQDEEKDYKFQSNMAIGQIFMIIQSAIGEEDIAPYSVSDTPDFYRLAKAGAIEYNEERYKMILPHIEAISNTSFEIAKEISGDEREGSEFAKELNEAMAKILSCAIPVDDNGAVRIDSFIKSCIITDLEDEIKR